LRKGEKSQHQNTLVGTWGKIGHAVERDHRVKKALIANVGRSPNRGKASDRHNRKLPRNLNTKKRNAAYRGRGKSPIGPWEET